MGARSNWRRALNTRTLSGMLPARAHRYSSGNFSAGLACWKCLGGALPLLTWYCSGTPNGHLLSRSLSLLRQSSVLPVATSTDCLTYAASRSGSRLNNAKSGLVLFGNIGVSGGLTKPVKCCKIGLSGVFILGSVSRGEATNFRPRYFF